jgi:hypothetical protein
MWNRAQKMKCRHYSGSSHPKLTATTDGLEIINLSASILMAIAFVPYGIQIIAKVLNPFLKK